MFTATIIIQKNIKEVKCITVTCVSLV